MAKEKNEVVKEAAEKYEYLTGDEEVQRLAFLKMKYELDRIAILETAREEGLEEGIKQGIEEGIKQGIEEGIKQGIEEGRNKGMAEGRVEGVESAKKEIAKEMLKSDAKIEYIERITKLPKEEILKLKDEK